MDTESFNKAIATMVEAFSVLNEKLKPLANTLQKMFDSFRKENIERKRTSPKTYGLAKIRRTQKYFGRTYRYIPTVRRHLPYQRRSY
jgi:hypothetical protein